MVDIKTIAKHLGIGALQTAGGYILVGAVIAAGAILTWFVSHGTGQREMTRLDAVVLTFGFAFALIALLAMAVWIYPRLALIWTALFPATPQHGLATHKGQRAPALQPEPQRAASSKPKFTRVGMESRLAALETIRAAVEKVADSYDTLRPPIFEKWPDELPKLGIGGYVKRAQELRDALDQAHSQIQAVLGKVEYADLKGMAGGWRAPPNSLMHLDIWIETVASLPASAKDDQPFAQKAAWPLYVEVIHTFTDWIDEMRQQIARKRAEYESAEVYQ